MTPTSILDYTRADLESRSNEDLWMLLERLRITYNQFPYPDRTQPGSSYRPICHAINIQQQTILNILKERSESLSQGT